MPSGCWLCTHCDTPAVVEMMRFVEDKSVVMHIDVIATEISASLRETFPEHAEALSEECVRQHIARHVVTPAASITRITRDLLDVCETLRPSVASLSRRKPAASQEERSGKRARDDADEVHSLPVSGHVCVRFCLA